jgi:hypothetical protein
MALAEINWNPTSKQLRQFGLVAMVALPSLGWIWSHGSWRIAGILLLVGLCLAVLGGLSPRTLRPIFVGLTMIAMPIAVIVSELALLFVFFCVVLPIGFLLRLCGRDLLQLKSNPRADTYWALRKQPTDVKSYYRQF